MPGLLSYQRLRPGLLALLVAGGLFIAAVTTTGSAAWAEDDPEAPSTIGGAAVVIPAGASILTWADQNEPAADVAARTGGGLIAIYGWDAGTARWLRFVPGAPRWATTLDVLEAGQAYVFIASEPVTIEFPGAAVTAPGS